MKTTKVFSILCVDFSPSAVDVVQQLKARANISLRVVSGDLSCNEDIQEALTNTLDAIIFSEAKAGMYLAPTVIDILRHSDHQNLPPMYVMGDNPAKILKDVSQEKNGFEFLALTILSDASISAVLDRILQKISTTRDLALPPPILRAVQRTTCARQGRGMSMPPAAAYLDPASTECVGFKYEEREGKVYFDGYDAGFSVKESKTFGALVAAGDAYIRLEDDASIVRLREKLVELAKDYVVGMNLTSGAFGKSILPSSYGHGHKLNFEILSLLAAALRNGGFEKSGVSLEKRRLAVPQTL